MSQSSKAFQENPPWIAELFYEYKDSVTKGAPHSPLRRPHQYGYPCVCMRHRGLLIAHTSQESSNRDKPDWESKQS